VKILLGISLYFTFSIILWLSTEFYFWAFTNVGFTRGITSALLDTLALVILVAIMSPMFRLFRGKDSYYLSFLFSAAIWSIGSYLLDVGVPHGDNFSFFAYGQRLIENGTITKNGHAIFRAILLSRITAVSVMTIGAILVSSKLMRSAK
jgi:hypothetical protein